jgi:hypothetical protein
MYFILASYTNYAPSYSGGYSSYNRYGYYGFYNPALLYFAVLPPFLFYGHYSLYHRYNPVNGYYYAPQLTYSGSNTSNVIINGTANSGNGDNYHYSYNISSNNKYLMADHAFFATSDFSAYAADFAYRLQFSDLIEFDDTNQNGFYDANEPVYSVTSLQDLAWEPFQVSNLTASYNTSLSYFQVTTSANAVYNNTAANITTPTNFKISVTYRASNVQINNTAPISIQPNSLQYDFALQGFPTTIASTHATARLGLVQLASTAIDEPIYFDVNTTTPATTASQIRTNETYGLSLGNYTEGRIEYEQKANITDATASGITAAWTSINAQTLATTPYYDSTDDWIWGDTNATTGRDNKLLVVTLPNYGANSTVSGFGFLDTDVMNAMASSACFLQVTRMNAMVILSIVLYFVIA